MEEEDEVQGTHHRLTPDDSVVLPVAVVVGGGGGSGGEPEAEAEVLVAAPEAEERSSASETEELTEEGDSKLNTSTRVSKGSVMSDSVTDLASGCPLPTPNVAASGGDAPEVGWWECLLKAASTSALASNRFIGDVGDCDAVTAAVGVICGGDATSGEPDDEVIVELPIVAATA